MCARTVQLCIYTVKLTRSTAPVSDDSLCALRVCTDRENRVKKIAERCNRIGNIHKNGVVILRTNGYIINDNQQIDILVLLVH